jgi:hypothetical protein
MDVPDPAPAGPLGRGPLIAVELAIISMNLYNPALATYRLKHTSKRRVGRNLPAWSIGSPPSFAIFTALAGLPADISSTRTSITIAGLLILASLLLLRRRPRPS